ncbi:hypothetical protein [uncultured Alloprevotella sp.]|uniref:hypothetical protein n=1 Tax=uncultured Alloprevotella sp. TaxID=1283315 RepID=UPI0026056DF6|nr:hypothetical protein [uncultured Alloprevotella sp.]
MRIVRFQSAFWSFRRRSFGLKGALMVSICRHAGKGEMRFFVLRMGGFLAFPEFGRSLAILKKGEAMMADEIF